MGAPPAGVTEGEWAKARMRACYARINELREVGGFWPDKVRDAFAAGWEDTSGNVAAYLDSTEGCSTCGGTHNVTVVDQGATIRQDCPECWAITDMRKCERCDGTGIRYARGMGIGCGCENGAIITRGRPE